MKHLGPYKKFIVAAAVIQSIIVVVAGYLLFKSKTMKDPVEHKAMERPGVEKTVKPSN